MYSIVLRQTRISCRLVSDCLRLLIFSIVSNQRKYWLSVTGALRRRLIARLQKNLGVRGLWFNRLKFAQTFGPIVSIQWATENPLDGSIIAYIPIHKSQRVHLQLDLPFTNFHIDYGFEIILTVVKLVALNLYDLCMKRAILKACFLWFATMITLRFDYIRTMRVNGFTTI